MCQAPGGFAERWLGGGYGCGVAVQVDVGEEEPGVYAMLLRETGL